MVGASTGAASVGCSTGALGADFFAARGTRDTRPAERPTRAGRACIGERAGHCARTRAGAATATAPKTVMDAIVLTVLVIRGRAPSGCARSVQ